MQLQTHTLVLNDLGPALGSDPPVTLALNTKGRTEQAVNPSLWTMEAWNQDVRSRIVYL